MSVDMTRWAQEIPGISRDTDAREVALGAYERLLEALEQLEPEEWRAPTECPGWDVAAMVGHLIGAAKAGASVRETLRQQRWARRHAEAFDSNRLDAANELQVRDHAHLTPDERIAELRRLAPAAVRGRMRLPRVLRRIELPLDPGGSNAAGMPATVSLGHLMDVIYTRDVWLHRVDIARATGRSVDLDSSTERRVVEDVVAEWAERHAQSFHLTLHGPAGGVFRHGEGGPELAFDPVEFCRVLSGRASGEGLLATRVLF
ncbi:maleylpyruvate isomerase family mycothiol-dependent enzyme [Egibacter rhizosphaerae]|uniref:Maleylpyruvate isomerase family mycothiol-dependent enzyme n=1 Tax=Egibacter rhizosphaerae TaxID=1670831 RepID=A0A411YB93_9ACTN|nr:maleylpyruvate isomerase family mycothiol-dependent enzyme [Egibacter rhizosphaerae]QBI18474.1 maleylpyruvate isomerase family mycothiol-dependent enzyme [Egibacter rhizosphaerae]